MSCIDIIVCKQPDGSLKCSPFFIRFSSKPKSAQIVKVYVNDEPHPQNLFENRRTPPDSYTGSAVLVMRQSDKYPFFINANEYIVSRGSNTGLLCPWKKYSDPSSILTTPTTPSYQSDLDDAWANGQLHYGSAPDANNTNNNTKKKRKRRLLRRVVSFSSVSEFLSEPDQDSSDASTPGTPTTPTTLKKPSWSERWLEKINRETHPHEKVTPPSDFLERLNLTDEVTKIKFVANGETIEGCVFLWDSKVSIIVSDIDGTITRSDLRGHVMARIGMFHIQRGILPLYNCLESRGYKFLYLSARPITQIYSTKKYLEGIKQEELSMPLGPCIIAPNKLWHAFAREVIIKKPDAYKIAILNTIKSIFPENPFFAGYGNRISDDRSYSAVGIDPCKAFRLNTKGQCFSASLAKFESLLHMKESLETLGLFPHISREDQEEQDTTQQNLPRRGSIRYTFNTVKEALNSYR